jgi:hypothetical protein
MQREYIHPLLRRPSFSALCLSFTARGGRKPPEGTYYAGGKCRNDRPADGRRLLLTAYKSYTDRLFKTFLNEIAFTKLDFCGRYRVHLLKTSYKTSCRRRTGAKRGILSVFGKIIIFPQFVIWDKELSVKPESGKTDFGNAEQSTSLKKSSRRSLCDTDADTHTNNCRFTIKIAVWMIVNYKFHFSIRKGNLDCYLDRVRSFHAAASH